MHNMMIMDVLQGCRNLLCIGSNRLPGKPRATWMTLAQVPLGHIVHDEKGTLLRDTKVANTQNMRMLKTNGASFIQKIKQIFRVNCKERAISLRYHCRTTCTHFHKEDFYSGLGLVLNMLGKIHLAKSSFAYRMNETIVFYYLSR